MNWLLLWQWRCGWCWRMLEVCQSKTNQSCLYFLALPPSAPQSCSNRAAQKSQQRSSDAPNCSPGTMRRASVGCWSRGKVKAHHKFHFSVYQQPRLTFTGNCLYWSHACVLSHRWNPVLFGGVLHASSHSPPRRSAACMSGRMVRRWQSQKVRMTLLLFQNVQQQRCRAESKNWRLFKHCCSIFSQTVVLYAVLFI